MTSQAKQRKIERRKRAEKILADLRGENNDKATKNSKDAS